MPVIRHHAEGVHLDARAPQSEHENAEDQLIEELARSQEKATLDAATAEVDEGMRSDVAWVLGHIPKSDAERGDRRSVLVESRRKRVFFLPTAWPLRLPIRTTEIRPVPALGLTEPPKYVQYLLCTCSVSGSDSASGGRPESLILDFH